MRTITISALNIALPSPHRQERYKELWLDAFDSQTPMRLRGDTGGLVGSANTPRRRDGRIEGDLLKFVNIDANGTWLDLATREPVTREDVERRVSIPPTYRPNLHSVPYIFFPQQHRLLFMSRHDQNNVLSPKMAEMLVEKFLSREHLVREYGQAVVTIEPNRETLAKIFALPVLKQIEIEVVPPNALGNVERQLMRFLEEQNATRYTQELSTNHPDGLDLTPAVKLAAGVAQSNGHVAARGLDAQGQSVRLSTEQHPYEEKVTFDPAITTAGDVFDEMSEQLLSHLATPVEDR